MSLRLWLTTSARWFTPSVTVCWLPMMSAKPLKVSHVVAAAIFNKQGDLLIAQRLLDKYMVGLWEFRGGKVEAGDAVTYALCHELDEELGIHLLSWESLICVNILIQKLQFCSMSGSSRIFMAKLMVGKGKP